VSFTLTARPSPGTINTPFGPRSGPRPTATSPLIHYGQDYGWGNGTDIAAAADGVVVEGDGDGQAGAYGNRTRVDHGGGIETWYCHQSVRLVRKGDRVKAGQRIGVQGATGNVTAKHLHFEVRLRGVAVDPEPYFHITPEPEGDADMALYTEQDKLDLQAARADALAAKTAAQAAERDTGEILRLLRDVERRGDNIQRGQDAQLAAQGVAKPEQRAA
jgi:hypothetical protein